jgi:P-type Ca2+ transporter type 2C
MTMIGLTSRQAAERSAADGRNDIPVGRAIGWPSALARQLTDTVILVLLAAAALTAAVGDLPDMTVIAAVIVINTLLGASQEVRSGRALAALADLTAPHATVVRDGSPQDIDARDVVRGDVIQLAAGDVIAADANLCAVESLLVDESMLTGESIPAQKRVSEPVFAGTVVTRGRAQAVVTSVGRQTAIGGIARGLRDSDRVLTPLQRQLASLGRRLAIGVSVAAVLVAVLNLAAGRGVETSVVLAISLAVAAIPESLPAVMSLSLAMAARRMAARGVLARRLAAVEALGSVTVLAADKTGTLTEGTMSVVGVWTPSGTQQASRDLLEAAVLCNDACMTDDAEPAVRDDPTEVALVRAAAAAGIDVPALRATFPRLAEVPFDAMTARMSTTHATPDGGCVVFVKGSPEALLDEFGAQDARDAAETFAGAGQRVLAVLEVIAGRRRPLGLIALADPVRADAQGVIESFRAAGVRPVMITGDHPRTAGGVAQAVGLWRTAMPIALGDDPLDTATSDVYARVRPDRKTAIVAELRRRGDVVAMTGDGVNDAPALHAADIGIAMGRRGTEVAKQAADLVLTSDNLSAMVPAIAEGRRAYDNLRRFLHYALSGGLAEVLIMLIGPVVGFALPLQAGQILWVNLLTHGVPGVAMGNEPAESDVLTRPPRPPRQSLVDRVMAERVSLLGVVIAAVSLLAGAYAEHTNRPWQSTIFMTLALAQLAAALALRPRWGRGSRNPFLLAAVAVNVLLCVAAVSWAPLLDLLRTDRLAPHDFVVCLAGAAAAGAVARWQVRRPRQRMRSVTAGKP